MNTSNSNKIERIDISLLAIRLMIGTVLVYHGAQKLFGGMDGFIAYNTQLGVPLPELSSYLAALTEFGGGLAIATGVLSRLAAVPVVITMLVAGLVAHTGFNVTTGGGEYPITLAVVTAALALSGPGRLTAWRLLGDRVKDSALVRA